MALTQYRHLRPGHHRFSIIFACLALAGLALTACSLVAPEHPEPTGRVVTHEIRSDSVRDNYVISVRLPPAYSATPASPYPVLFQLDVNLGILDEFNVTCGYVSDYEASGQIPPTIVVGIGYPEDYDVDAMRARDYTIPMENPPVPANAKGGAKAFGAFISQELIPFLQARYPIAGPARRALLGHSLGGLFTLYHFLQHDDATTITGFVAASPSIWFDGGTIYKSLDVLDSRTLATRCILYLTMGDLEGPDMVPYFDDFRAKISSRNYGWLRFSAQKYNTDHLKNISPSFRDGIKYLFAQGL